LTRFHSAVATPTWSEAQARRTARSTDQARNCAAAEGRAGVGVNVEVGSEVAVEGGTVAEALARAALAVPSAALGLSGFALALVDPRGQTLHDKLCGAVVVRR